MVHGRIAKELTQEPATSRLFSCKVGGESPHITVLPNNDAWYVVSISENCRTTLKACLHVQHRGLEIMQHIVSARTLVHACTLEGDANWQTCMCCDD
ncbi:hypothetical protein BRADI_3g33996v3 [Brachypodium distachyon]|uniref:Uncharacterized protein n=1 Tax=Brachypodium distachyon TaxID=15368 RepID=A0A0Q3FFL2_BRADI|nr:hypothetical protein BRADI_3g33996v3 [Brachypodium distachyon]